MKAFIQGQGVVTLNNSDFLAEGGEGKVYVKGGTAFKIYTDPKKMIPLGKIKELASISNSRVQKPLFPILDQKGNALGFTMNFTRDAYVLCSLFPVSFRKRHSVEPGIVLDLVKQLQEIVSDVHQAKCLIVDLNEMNFLVNKDFSEIVAIDVDSYQTPSFPATALMETVRDRHMKKGLNGSYIFNQGTDWFAFAITSYQMFRGIHPYKNGKHPTLKSLDERMLNNVTVMHPDVRVPKNTLSEDVIPKEYRDWYHAVLVNGIREPPPLSTSTLGTIIIGNMNNIHGSEDLLIDEILSIPENEMIRIHFAGSQLALISDRSFFIASRRVHARTARTVGVGFTPKLGRPILFQVVNKSLYAVDSSTKKETIIPLSVDDFVCFNGTAYVRAHNQIFEVQMHEVGDDNVMYTVQPGPTVMPFATQLFKGVVYQNMLGESFFILFPNKGESYHIKIPELNGYKITDAKFENGVLVVIGTDVKASLAQYDKFILRFCSNYETFDVRKIENVSLSLVNFTVLDSGICIMLSELGEIEIFSNRMGSKNIKTLSNQDLQDVEFLSYLGGAAFIRNNKVFSMKMK